MKCCGGGRRRRAEDGSRIFIPTNSTTARPHFAACDIPRNQLIYPSRGRWVVRLVDTFQLTTGDLLHDCQPTGTADIPRCSQAFYESSCASSSVCPQPSSHPAFSKDGLASKLTQATQTSTTPRRPKTPPQPCLRTTRTYVSLRHSPLLLHSSPHLHPHNLTRAIPPSHPPANRNDKGKTMTKAAVATARRCYSSTP